MFSVCLFAWTQQTRKEENILKILIMIIIIINNYSPKCRWLAVALLLWDIMHISWGGTLQSSITILQWNQVLFWWKLCKLQLEHCYLDWQFESSKLLTSFGISWQELIEISKLFPVLLQYFKTGLLSQKLQSLSDSKLAIETPIWLQTKLATVWGDYPTSSAMCACFEPDVHRAIIFSLFSSGVVQ